MASLRMEILLAAVDRVTAPLRGMQSQIQRTAQSLREQQAALRALGTVPNRAALTREQREQQRQIEQTTQSIARQRAELARLNQVQGSINRVNNVRTGLRNNGAMALGAGVAGAYGITKMLAPGIEFDKEMSRVQGLARLEKNSDDMKMLRQDARDLGSSTWADPTQVGQGQGFLAMAGFSPDAIHDAMPGMLDLARSSGIEIARAADISSNILSAFDIPANQMTRVADVLTGTFTRANVDMEMLGDTMKYVAPIAKTLGRSLEETAAMTGILGNSGIQGSNAGTAMRSIYKRLAAPPKMARDALQSLGINTKDKKGNLRATPEILLEAIKKTAKLGNAERVAKLVAIAGTEAGAAMATIADSGNLEKLITLTDALNNNMGESKKMAGVMADNLDGDIEQLTSGFTELQISLQDGVNPQLRDLTQWITKIINSTGKWIKDNPKLASSLTMITGGFIGLVAAGGGLAITLWAVTAPLTILMGLLGLTVIPVLIIIGKFLLFGAAIYTVCRYWEFFVWLFRDGFGEILGEIPLLGGTLQTMWVIAQTVFDAILNGIFWIIQCFTDWDTAMSALNSLWDSLKTKASEAIDYILGKIQPLIDAIRKVTDFVGITGKGTNAATAIENVPALKSKYGKYSTSNDQTRNIPKIEGAQAANMRFGRYSQSQAIIPSAADTTKFVTPVLTNSQNVNQTNTFNITTTAGTDTKAVAKEVANMFENKTRFSGIRTGVERNALLGDPAR